MTLPDEVLKKILAARGARLPKRGHMLNRSTDCQLIKWHFLVLYTNRPS